MFADMDGFSAATLIISLIAAFLIGRMLRASWHGARCSGRGVFRRRDAQMHVAALALVGALGFGASAVSASAAPPAPNLDAPQASNIVQVAGGCGRGFHPNRWGRCVPNRYGYYGPRPY